MINVWWFSRPKRRVTEIPSIIASVMSEAVGQEWSGNRKAHLAIEEALEHEGLKRVGDRRDQSGSGARTYNAWLRSYGFTFEYNGKTYTPKSFAQELGLDMNDYLPVTSFSHHDFYKPFVLEVPDNWDHGLYYNVPMEEMQQIVDNAIEKGYTVLWAADVSEKGFKWYDGVALMPKVDRNKAKEGTELSRWVKLKDSEKEDEMYDFKGPVEEIEVTQESRQQGFDNYETTDDHGMVIVGTAVDQKGNKYYKVKNSWDSEQVYDGYFYISMPYFLAKTMSIMVNKDAVPSEILGKLNM